MPASGNCLVHYLHSKLQWHKFNQTQVPCSWVILGIPIPGLCCIGRSGTVSAWVTSLGEGISNTSAGIILLGGPCLKTIRCCRLWHTWESGYWHVLDIKGYWYVLSIILDELRSNFIRHFVAGDMTRPTRSVLCHVVVSLEPRLTYRTSCNSD